jgi:hypothetical protein
VSGESSIPVRFTFRRELVALADCLMKTGGIEARTDLVAIGENVRVEVWRLNMGCLEHPPLQEQYGDWKL